MYDSRTDRFAAPHARRADDTWSVKGVLTVHPAKPTLTECQAIAEGLSDLLDIVDMASIAMDGIDCEWDLTLPPSAPFRTESRRYDVQVAVRLDMDAQAKVRRTKHNAESATMRNRDIDPYTGLPYGVRNPGGFIQATTRKVRR